MQVTPRARGPHPCFKLGENIFVVPIAYNDLSVELHPAPNEPELPIAMCRLIEVHEIHVDARPWQLGTELSVQMEERSLQGLEARNPHLGRREGVHPRD